MSVYHNLLVSAALGVVGLVASFNVIAGFMTVGQGVMIVLFDITLMSLLNIHIRLEELLREEGV